jgi:hypothetical protein
MRLTISALALLVALATSGCGSPCDRSDLALTDLTMPSGQVGVAYDQAISATTVTTGVTSFPTIAVASGTLPPGLAIQHVRDSDWRLSGTPTLAGTFSFRLGASEYSTQCSGRSGTFAVTLTVAP